MTIANIWGNVWNNNLAKESDHSLPLYSFPSSNLTAFVRYEVSNYLMLNKSRQSLLKWLDIGCAKADHLCHLHASLDRFNQFILTDISNLVLQAAVTQMLSAYTDHTITSFLSAQPTAYPLEEGSVDIVNAESSLYYSKYDDFLISIREVYRILKPGGICRIYTKSDRDRYCQKDWQISDFTYRVDLNGHWEDGIVLTCLSLHEIQSIFSVFNKVSIGLEEYDFTGSSGLKSFYIITAFK